MMMMSPQALVMMVQVLVEICTSQHLCVLISVSSGQCGHTCLVNPHIRQEQEDVCQQVEHQGSTSCHGGSQAIQSVSCLY